MKKFISLLALFICLSACSQKTDNNSYEEKHEGVIASITKPEDAEDARDGWYSMLVISDVDDSDISGRKKDELIELAQENDGASYDVSPDIYDEDKIKLNEGVKVNIYWGKSEGESDPPVREAKKIEAIPE